MRTLEELAATITGHDVSAADVDAACAEAFSLFTSVSPAARSAAQGGDESTQLASGLALPPQLAATCLLDAARTRVFLRATIAAIRDAVARRIEPVEVVYAGSGPFAPMALLTLPLLRDFPLRFTIIDIHRASLAACEELFDHFALTSFVRAFIHTDATTYRHTQSIDIVISETLQRSLAREPFVAILRNLVPQLSADGALIPRTVTVSLCRVGVTPAPVEELGQLLRINREQLECPPRSLQVAGGSQPLALLTRIEAGAGEVLEPYASGLTTPEILWSIDPSVDALFSSRYVDGPNPRLEWSLKPR